MTNRLIGETSPYLLQHAHNPVDWYPWGPEALERAKAEDKPIFLSIGYSACHWCHVMERESFELEETAAILNRDFVSIKVDREERPDIDSIYMQAVQVMTGRGGWPMSMFLTPAGVPFYGGTYFPPEDRHGMPSFQRILAHVADAYRNRKDEVAQAAGQIRSAIAAEPARAGAATEVTREALESAAMRIAASFDPVHGGFGGAPKFPPAMSLDFLLQVVARTSPSSAGVSPAFGRGTTTGSHELSHVITFTLQKMARGGMYDQIGGGFHRYSVDARWLVPHFEKMLYDNALLARLYTRAWQWTKDPFFARIAKEILGFVEREMTSPEGGFYSTLDADSEGVEGKFYVWSRSEVLEVLGEQEGRIFCALFDITDKGNWEDHNIPNVPRDPESVAGDHGISIEALHDLAARGKCKLYGRREERIRPGRDEKILAGWNGWMLAAFAEASLAFGRESDESVVRRNADFLIMKMADGQRLFRSYKDGRVKIGGLLEDYSGVAWGLVAAFEATQERRYLDRARELAGIVLERFSDETASDFFDTPSDHEPLITRPKDRFDNATPAGNSVAVHALQRLGLYFDEPRFTEAARSAVEAGWPLAGRYPSGFGLFLGTAEWHAGSPLEIAITGPGSDELVRAVGGEFVPHRIFVWKNNADLPLMEGRPADRTAAYLCHDYVCEEPVTDAVRLREMIRGQGSGVGGQES